LQGFFPILPTIFHDDGSVDEKGVRDVVDFLVWGGAHGITMLANASEGFALSDEEKDRLTDVVMEAAAGRIPVVVTVNHFSSRVAARRAARAEAAGAAAVMALPPFYGSQPADLRAVHEFYLRLSEAVSIPVIVQDDPLLTGVNMAPEFLAALVAEAPNIRYIKLEAPQSPYKMSGIRECAGDTVGLFGGMGGIVFLEELERGACGTMPSAALLELGTVYRMWVGGRREEARRLYYRKWLPFINFEVQLALRNITKEVLCMAGVIRSAHVRHPCPASFDDVTREQLRRLVGELDLQVFQYRGHRARPGSP
jgi:dihydrodipicolinate synthase/N-acetylneuraminate lyase